MHNTNHNHYRNTQFVLLSKHIYSYHRAGAVRVRACVILGRGRTMAPRTALSEPWHRTVSSADWNTFDMYVYICWICMILGAVNHRQPHCCGAVRCKRAHLIDSVESIARAQRNVAKYLLYDIYVHSVCDVLHDCIIQLAFIYRIALVSVCAALCLGLPDRLQWRENSVIRDTAGFYDTVRV